MKKKYKNMITIRLTDEQNEFLIKLITDNMYIESMAQAIRHCINTEIHYSKATKEQISEEKDGKLYTIINQ